MSEVLGPLLLEVCDAALDLVLCSSAGAGKAAIPVQYSNLFLQEDHGQRIWL